MSLAEIETKAPTSYTASPVNDPDRLLRRSDAALALTDAGFKTAATTLATLACRGGGPVFRRYGRVPLYRWQDLLDWANSRLSPPMRSTSGADAA